MEAFSSCTATIRPPPPFACCYGAFTQRFMTKRKKKKKLRNPQRETLLLCLQNTHHHHHHHHPHHSFPDALRKHSSSSSFFSPDILIRRSRNREFNKINLQWTLAYDGGDGREGGHHGDHGDGGGGHHGGHGYGNGGDENKDWFSEGERKAYFMFLLHVLRKHVRPGRIKALIPALILQLFLYKNINAFADAFSKSKVIGGAEGAVFGIRGGTWTRFLIDSEKDEFVVDPVTGNNVEQFASPDHLKKNSTLNSLEGWGLPHLLKQCSDFVRNLMLPEGYPSSVTGDYLEYSLWRMGQLIACQINGVLTTQALLYAVGLGKGAIPTAAAINWVLKDGIGYLSKIMLAKYGRHFDVQPKGWRLLADLLENGSYALELLTPIYPNLFVYLGAAAGAGKSAAGLIQAATRSCFYAGFAAQRNFAEVIAKGEAQGMVSKSIGILGGIVVSHYVGPSGTMLAATFLVVSGVHMFCNLRSYQAVQLRTLNPYRASLVFGEYIKRGVIASVEEVNAEEPIFTGIPIQLFKNGRHKDSSMNLLSLQTKRDAAVIASKLNLGVSFGNIMRTQMEADELFKLYEKEEYILAGRRNSYQVLLKVGATSHDLLKMMLQVCYLYHLENIGSSINKNVDYEPSNPVELSHKLMLEKFGSLQEELSSAGWTLSDGLVSRPRPYRIIEALP